MTGLFWPVFCYFSVCAFLLVAAYRILRIIRMPIHLRWELAPVPGEKPKGKYGGSYFEEYEWWRQPRKHSLISQISYILREILTLKSIWRNKRSLWPLSFLLHWGIYLFIISLPINFISSLMIIYQAPSQTIEVFQDTTSVLLLAGFGICGAGVIGLLLKRRLDSNYASFTTFPMYFRLILIGMISVSGIVAWSTSADYGGEISRFTANLLTLNSNISLTAASAIHIILVMLFIIYLPLTDMMHFITKYFTYHTVRWDDSPLNAKTEAMIKGLIKQPISWAAAHIAADEKKSWDDVTVGESIEEKKS
jgi:nitrate reductase gamma subunit